MRADIVRHLRCPSCGSSSLSYEARERRGPEIWRGWLRCDGCARDYEIIEGIPALEVAPPRRAMPCERCGRRVEAILEPWPSFVSLKGGLAVCPRCGEVIEELKCEELTSEEENYIRKRFVEEDFAGTAFMYEWGRLIVPTLVYGFSYRALARVTARRMGARTGLFLDVATGTGMVALELGKLVPQRQIFGVDLALEMLKLGSKKAERRGLKNLTFIKGDAERLPFRDQTFDGVTCQASFNLFPQPEVALSEMWRVMKRGSKLAISVVCRPPRPSPLLRAFLYVSERIGHEARFFSGSEVSEMLEKRGFEEIDAEWHGAAMLIEAKKK